MPAVFLISVLFTISGAQASPSDWVSGSGIPVQERISQLEQAISKPGNALALAELYFMTSRCGDLERLIRAERSLAGSELACACRLRCGKNTEGRQLEQFRELLEKGARWSDPRVKKLWSRLVGMPEASYWALKAIRTRREAYQSGPLRGLRLDLEKTLETLEVPGGNQ